jgi:Family of unknown function (DUF6498)
VLPVAIGNLVPLVGVLFFGWDLPSLVVMYWIETGVVGLINVLRIRKSLALGPGTTDAAGAVERPIIRGAASGSWLMALLWLLAYAVFWAILGLVVIQVANGGFYEGASRTGWTGPSGAVVAWGTVSLVGGALAGYVVDYVVGQRYLTVSSLELLRDPFVRVFVIAATIAVGGVGIAVTGSGLGFLGAMAIAKTIVEIWFARMASAASTTSSV